MARPIRNRLGLEGGVYVLSDVGPSPELSDRLWTIAKPFLHDARHRPRLDHICQMQLADRAIRAGDATPTEANYAIDIARAELAKVDDRTRDRAEAFILALPHRAGWEVQLALRVIAGPEDPGRTQRGLSAFTLEELDQALVLARKVVRGPCHVVDLRRTVALLVDLYEDATGKRATHSASLGQQHVGEAQSPAGRFITAIVKVLEPEVPFTTPASLLQKRLTARRRADRAAVQTFLTPDDRHLID